MGIWGIGVIRLAFIWGTESLKRIGVIIASGLGSQVLRVFRLHGHGFRWENNKINIELKPTRSIYKSGLQTWVNKIKINLQGWNFNGS